MSQIIRDMRGIYRLKHYDFMGYTFRNINELSFHHIKKKCDGGEKIIENGALLNEKTSHPYLHIIEDRDTDIYNYINKILKEITMQYAHPTKEQLIAIRRMLIRFEAEHCMELNAKDKPLIKTLYVERRIDL